MMYLQIDTLRQTGQHIERFFNTTPDTVYGLLTGALALAVVALWLAYWRQTSQYTGKLVELNLDCQGTLKDLVAVLERVKDAGVVHHDDVVQCIEKTNLRIDNLSELLRNGYRKSTNDEK